MESEFLKAKELFDYYGGSKYQMMRDEMLNEYLSYNISEDIEFKWINELFYKIYNQLNNNCDYYIYMSTFIDMHPKILLNNIHLLEDFISKNCENFKCQKEIKILIDTILEVLYKIEDIKFNNEILKFEKLKEHLDK